MAWFGQIRIYCISSFAFFLGLPTQPIVYSLNKQALAVESTSRDAQTAIGGPKNYEVLFHVMQGAIVGAASVLTDGNGEADEEDWWCLPKLVQVARQRTKSTELRRRMSTLCVALMQPQVVEQIGSTCRTSQYHCSVVPNEMPKCSTVSMYSRSHMPNHPNTTKVPKVPEVPRASMSMHTTRSYLSKHASTTAQMRKCTNTIPHPHPPFL